MKYLGTWRILPPVAEARNFADFLERA